MCRKAIVFFTFFIVSGCFFILSGCGYFQIHKPIIEQGNVFTEAKIKRLHHGMTPSAVVAVMGTPMLEEVFTPHELNYVYTYQVGNHPRLLKKVICMFRHGHLTQIKNEES